MTNEETPRTLRVPLFTRGAKIRLSVAAALVACVALRWWATSVRMPGRSFRGPLAPLDAPERERRDRLRAHVVALAAEIGPRSTSFPSGLVRAARCVRDGFEASGYTVARETFRADGMACENLIAERAGTTTPRSSSWPACSRRARTRLAPASSRRSARALAAGSSPGDPRVG